MIWHRLFKRLVSKLFSGLGPQHHDLILLKTGSELMYPYPEHLVLSQFLPLRRQTWREGSSKEEINKLREAKKISCWRWEMFSTCRSCMLIHLNTVILMFLKHLWVKKSCSKRNKWKREELRCGFLGSEAALRYVKAFPWAVSSWSSSVVSWGAGQSPAHLTWLLGTDS